MNVLVACEFSGIVRDAFIARGHDAISCDLLPSERPGPHIQDDIMEVLAYNPEAFDLMIAHPPCTYLARSGARWWANRKGEQEDAVQFVKRLADAPIGRICIENPVGRLSTAFRKPDQYLQPWQFGHGETKKTGLWLIRLLPLVPTNIVEGRESRVHLAPGGPNQWKVRSRTLQGIADAMALQWG